jgi:hypothetical protein
MNIAVFQYNFICKNRWQLDLAQGPQFADPWIRLKNSEKLLKSYKQMGVVVHSCNPRIRKLRQKDFKLETSLGYLVRLSLKKKKSCKP